ncbi:DEKNAAC103317 [Brettanomyces naardenensis]|uniref:Malate synthase n=1 Tax=Brettanomyces naardenensis TaxID=13370 RepID=A0A448YND0_BRENA|nr:DEKNAAC103317 [Brettanomyces naardenensis]
MPSDIDLIERDLKGLSLADMRTHSTKTTSEIALELFELASAKEHVGLLTEAADYYRKAYKLDDRVDMRYREKLINDLPPLEKRAGGIPKVDHRFRKLDLSKIKVRRLLESFRECRFEPLDEARPVYLSILPDEIVMRILRLLIVDNPTSWFSFSMTCKKLAYLGFYDTTVVGEVSDKSEFSPSSPHDILTQSALKFVVFLHRTFNGRRKTLLEHRQVVQKELDQGGQLHFLEETAYIRDDPNWKCLPAHPKLQCRKVEITGPPDAKMIVNAFNTNVQTYMTDFEDSCAPTWHNMIYGQVNLYDAVRDKIDFTNEKTGKRYKIKKEGRRVPVMIVRPRGWHMVDRHILVDGEPISASILDFGLFFFHNAKYLISQGLGPFFYLPKMEHWKEAKLWDDIFAVSEDSIEIPRGTIKATVLIETLPISYQLDEVLYALREHSSGLNCGRWDYMFSTIKRLRNQKEHILPDRHQVTMTVPFMSNYVKQLIKVCHKRGVHAMGGMAAFIPRKDDPVKNAEALQAVHNDKLREVLAGHDGTWIAHPGLLATARSVFEEYMPTPNQVFKQKPETSISEADLVDTNIEGGQITRKGVDANIYIGLNYMESWLRGYGCVPINHMMEDAATAEVSRLSLFTWSHHGVILQDTKEKFTPELAVKIINDEAKKLATTEGNKFAEAAKALTDEISDKKPVAEFLTDILYPQIATTGKPLDVNSLKA